MSCKNKLSNLPIISNIDEQFKKLTPSSLEGLSPKQKAQKIAAGFGNMVGDITSQVGTQLKNFTGEATGKLSDLGGLIGGLGSDLKAGIPEDLKGISSSVASAIVSTKNLITGQYSSQKGLLDCEEETTSENLRDTQETTKIKTAVMSTSVNETKNLSNKEIKNISENEQVSQQKTQEITQSTIEQGAPKVAQAKSNKEVVSTQTVSLSSLQTSSSPQSDKFKTDNQTLYNEYESIVKEINNELSIIFANPKPYVDDEKVANANKIRRILNSTLVPNTNNLEKLYNQNQIDLQTASFNMQVNNKQCLMAKYAVLRTNNKMQPQTYITNINTVLSERLTLLEANDKQTKPLSLVINLIKGSII